MGVREAGERAIATRHFSHRHEHGADSSQQQLHALAHQHEIRVVGDVGARRAEVNEGPGGGRLIAEVMDMGHHVVPHPSLVLGGLVEIGIVEVRAQLRQRGIGNLESQLFLRLHQRQPQPPPQTDTAAVAPERLHRGGGVACGERRDPAQTAALARATSLLQSARN